MDTILQLLNALQAQISGLTQALNDATSAVQSAVDSAVGAAVAPLNQQISDLTAAGAAKDAQITSLQTQLAAATQPGGITQDQVDALVKAATDPLNAQIASLQGQVTALQTQVDGIPAQVTAAVEALKAQVKAKLDADLGDLDGLLAPS